MTPIPELKTETYSVTYSPTLPDVVSDVGTLRQASEGLVSHIGILSTDAEALVKATMDVMSVKMNKVDLRFKKTNRPPWTHHLVPGSVLMRWGFVPLLPKMENPWHFLSATSVVFSLRASTTPSRRLASIVSSCGVGPASFRLALSL